MTEPEKDPQHHEVHISLEQPAPKPPKVHRFRDICWLVVAAALIGTVFHNSAVFAIVACIAIVLYIAGGPNKP